MTFSVPSPLEIRSCLYLVYILGQIFSNPDDYLSCYFDFSELSVNPIKGRFGGPKLLVGRDDGSHFENNYLIISKSKLRYLFQRVRELLTRYSGEIINSSKNMSWLVNPYNK